MSHTFALVDSSIVPVVLAAFLPVADANATRIIDISANEGTKGCLLLDDPGCVVVMG